MTTPAEQAITAKHRRVHSIWLTAQPGKPRSASEGVSAGTVAGAHRDGRQRATSCRRSRRLTTVDGRVSGRPGHGPRYPAGREDSDGATGFWSGERCDRGALQRRLGRMWRGADGYVIGTIERHFRPNERDALCHRSDTDSYRHYNESCTTDLRSGEPLQARISRRVRRRGLLLPQAGGSPQ